MRSGSASGPHAALAPARADPSVSVDRVDPDREPGVGLLIARVVGIAALVIAASAALFVGLGQLGEDEIVVADAPEERAAPEPDEEPEEPDPEPDPAPAPEEEPDTEPEGDEEPDADEEPDTEEPEEAPEEEAPEEEAEEEPEEERIDPGSISVQVLDGYQDDGGSAADAVAAELSDAGYRIVARNPALRYDVTAVLWTAGNEAAGEQIARDISAAEVREQPGNLSTSVMVHVVVGADRG